MLGPGDQPRHPRTPAVAVIDRADPPRPAPARWTHFYRGFIGLCPRRAIVW